MATRIQLRRGTAAEWTSANPVLAAGEVGVELDTNKFKIGTGKKAWKLLPYANGGAADIPTKLSQLENDCEFITIDDVGTAGYTKNEGTVKSVNNVQPDANGNVTISAGEGSVKSVNNVGPDASGNVTLTIPPEVTDTTVGNWGYTKNAGTVTKVNNTTPDAQGNVSIAIPAEVTETTVTNWGFTKNAGTVTSVNNTQPDANGNVTIPTGGGSVQTVNNVGPDANGNVTLSIPAEVTETTVTNWGFTKNEGTVTTVNNVSPVDGNVELSIPSAASDISYTNPEYPTVAAALDQLLYVKPTVSLTGGSTNEDGVVLNSITLNWSTNKAITSQSIDQGIGTLANDLRTYTYTTATSTDKKFTITVGDGKNTATSSTTVSFKNKKFYGISNKDSLTDAEIKNLATNEWCSGKALSKKTFDCTPTVESPAGFYIYYALPTSFVASDPTFKINGLQTTAYLKTVKADYQNGQNKTVSYTIYRFMADNKLTTTYELEAV